jgi:hypothetical protein
MFWGMPDPGIGQLFDIIQKLMTNKKFCPPFWRGIPKYLIVTEGEE